MAFRSPGTDSGLYILFLYLLAAPLLCTKAKWKEMLSSSARISLLAYQDFKERRTGLSKRPTFPQGWLCIIQWRFLRCLILWSYLGDTVWNNREVTGCALSRLLAQVLLFKDVECRLSAVSKSRQPTKFTITWVLALFSNVYVWNTSRFIGTKRRNPNSISQGKDASSRSKLIYVTMRMFVQAIYYRALLWC